MRKITVILALAVVLLSACREKHVYKATMIEFMDKGCHACEKIQPMMEELKTEYKGLVDIQIIDVRSGEGQEKTGIYGLNGTPTLIFLDENGREFFRLEKTIQKDVITALLNTKTGPLPAKK